MGIYRLKLTQSNKSSLPQARALAGRLATSVMNPGFQSVLAPWNPGFSAFQKQRGAFQKPRGAFRRDGAAGTGR
jgi:hypothetical protein